VALLYADPVWKARLHQFFSASATWPLLCLALLVLEALPEVNWKLSFVLITVKAILMPLLILGTVIHSSKLPGRVLETPVFRWLGRLSYSLYLWQQLFLVWAEDRVAGLGLLQTFPINLAAVFACAAVSMLLIETPLIAVGHRMAKRIQRA
jgi:peptidoglycan/LPS O-acetylase OafA/YrhL